MSDATLPVQCELHSETPATFVCRHLRAGIACGFHCSDEDPADPWPDAWCDLCEADMEEAGEGHGWSAADLSLSCTGCYETIRMRNQSIPGPLHAGQLDVSPLEFIELARQACERGHVRQEAAMRTWPMFASAKHWYYDSHTRTLRFYNDPASPGVVADVTIVGSFSQRSNTWLWCWANAEYSEPQRARMEPLQVFGEVRGIEKFQSSQWRGEEIDAWEVTQIAADLFQAEAVYRAPMDHLFVFMLLNRFRSYHAS